MAKIGISLPGALLNAKKFDTTAVEKISINGAAVTATTKSDSQVIIENFGTLTLNEAKDKVIFTAASNFKAGEYGLIGNLDVAKIDLSAVTGDMTFAAGDVYKATTVIGGAGNDNLALSVAGALNGGAGDDTLTANGNTTNTVSLTGGTGADKFVQTAEADKTFIVDYDYSQGDSVSLGAEADKLVLAKDGKLSEDSNEISLTAAIGTDNVYKVKVQNQTKEEQYWTAAAKDAVTIDASAVAATTNMTIDGSAATTLAVQGGAGKDTISIKGAKATLTVNSKSNEDKVYGFDTGFEGDVINLSGVALKDVKLDATNKGLAIGNATVTLDGATFGATAGEINFKVDGGDTKKVAIANAAGDATIVSAAADADVYLGNKTTEVDFSGYNKDGFVVDLTNTDKFININSIKGAKSGGTYVGTAGAETFNFEAATKASEVWAGKGKNAITFKDNAVQDTVWFGSADGADTTVTNFKIGDGFAATNDVLYLYDTADLSRLEFTAEGVKLDSATSLTAAGGLGVAGNILIKNAAKEVKKVAYMTAGAAATVAADGADFVIGKANADDQTAQYKKDGDVVANLYDTTKYKNVDDVEITAANTTGNNVVIGKADGASKISLAGASAEVWGGSKENDAIIAGAGKNTIWFGTNDGADVVTSFDLVNDKIKIYDKALTEIAGAYIVDVTGLNHKFTSTTNSKDSLDVDTLADNTKVTFVDKDNKETKAVIGTSQYTKDAKIYMGGGANVVTANATEDLVLYLGNGTDGATVNDIYFSGIKSINAAGSTGKTVLIGNKAYDNVLTGSGTNSNAIWGGSSTNDEMVGGSAADEFWFSTGDGRDKVTAGVGKADKIVLYSITSIDDVAVTAGNGSFVVSLKDASSLTVTDAGLSALDGGLTFQLGVNADAKSYTYNRINGKFEAKA